eukprot:m.436886 g.436886  ORF g.436886 m.436886 type:complete len:131 (-) comp21427_c1_seq1:1103-1495(-)
MAAGNQPHRLRCACAIVRHTWDSVLLSLVQRFCKEKTTLVTVGLTRAATLMTSHGTSQGLLERNAAMNATSASVSLTVTALYKLARRPPTERWPFNCVNPAAVASFTNFASRSAFPPLIRKGTFMRERAA